VRDYDTVKCFSVFSLFLIFVKCFSLFTDEVCSCLFCQVFSPFHSDGPIEKELIPKLTIVRRNLSSKVGVAIPDINVRSSFLKLYIFWNVVNFYLYIPF